MIEMLSAERSLVEVAGLMRRGDGTGRKLQSVALTSLTEFPRRQSARVPTRPARTGKPRRRRVFGGCRPGSVGLSGRVADARISGRDAGRSERYPRWRVRCDSPGNGAASDEKPRFAPGNGVLRARRSAGPGPPSSIGGGLRFARKWRRKGLKRLNPRPEIAPPTGAVHRKPAACRLRSAVDETECEVARNSQGGACRASPTDFVPRRPSPQAMGRMLAGSRVPTGIHLRELHF